MRTSLEPITRFRCNGLFFLCVFIFHPIILQISLTSPTSFYPWSTGPIFCRDGAREKELEWERRNDHEGENHLIN